ncbi:hypothetical protein Tco_0228195, partial [Tanacetum coccineum]
MLKFTIKSTDKAALKEYDLKKDENSMDKGVADTVQDHKRKHDDDEEDDDDDKDLQLDQTRVSRPRGEELNSL